MLLKMCSKCEMDKPPTDFYPRKKALDGLDWVCKACSKAAALAHQRANYARYKARHKEWRDRNRQKLRERLQAWRASKPEIVKRHRRKHKAARRAEATAEENTRRARKLQATVAWADAAAMKALFREARLLSQMFDSPFHVDHIIPLQGENVCGLHWEGNLQILPAAINISKKNKLLPEHASC